MAEILETDPDEQIAIDVTRVSGWSTAVIDDRPECAVMRVVENFPFTWNSQHQDPTHPPPLRRIQQPALPPAWSR